VPHLQNSTAYHTQDYTTPNALVVGTEATGLTQEWRDDPKHNPDAGEIDSMNVSVAAAILILKLKDNEDFKLPILGEIKKKEKKTQNYENKLFALITVITTSLSRQITEPQVDALVNKTLTAFNVPGIAVAIIKDGKVVLAKGMGEIHRHKRKVDANTFLVSLLTAKLYKRILSYISG
jgi:hypothetical protein